MNLAFYVLVYEYLNDKINTFGSTLMGNVMGVVSGLALILVTLWILVQGYRIATGQSRESLMVFVVRGARVAFIVTVASSMAIFGSNIHDLLATTLPNEINGLFNNSSTPISVQEQVNTNLAGTVAAMAAIDAVQAPPTDVAAVTAKARASDLAIFGTASPPMAVGAMLLMYNLALALIVGLGPLFILCLIFDSTKSLFQRWLMYGIATIFSLAMLSFVSTIVLDVAARYAAALWATSLLTTLTNSTSEGLTTQAMEQGGVGLLMTMLIISGPPMAAQFFQGTLGSFMAYSAFNGGASSRPGPQGQPTGSYAGGGSPTVSANTSTTGNTGGTGGYNTSGPATDPTHANRFTSGPSTAGGPSETIRQGGGLASPPPAGLPPPGSYNA